MFEDTPERPLSPVQRVAVTGMAAAVVCAATSVIKVPTLATGGYLNLGDVAVIFLAFRLGPRLGGVAGGLGSAIADLLGGYPAFVPVTLVAKGGEGMIAGWLGGPGASIPSRVGGAVLGGLWMACCYLAWEFLLVGAAPAYASFPGNLVQGGLGVIGALLLAALVSGRQASAASAASTEDPEAPTT